MACGNNCYHAPLDHQSSLKWSDGALYAHRDTSSLIYRYDFEQQNLCRRLITAKKQSHSISTTEVIGI